MLHTSQVLNRASRVAELYRFRHIALAPSGQFCFACSVGGPVEWSLLVEKDVEWSASVEIRAEIDRN